uniref:LIC11966 family surface protein n=1 Tax=Roseivirga sp. TaxID=1964215 RepID=UPI004048541E
MLQSSKRSILTFLIIVVFSYINSTVSAQEILSPVDYTSRISEETKEIAIDMMQYASASAHGKSDRKVDKRRRELIRTSLNAIKAVQDLNPYTGDSSYRDAVVNALYLAHAVFVEDYEQIIDIEELSTSSYDYMETYLAAVEMANHKLQTAYTRRNEAERAFALMHNITLVESKNDLARDLELSNEVNRYSNSIYLLLFKNNLEMDYLTTSMNEGDIPRMEIHLNNLKKYSQEGIDVLDSMSSFKRTDNSLINSGRSLLNFYKRSISGSLNTMIDFYSTKYKFEKAQKNIESISAVNRTKEDIGEFNALVKKYNQSINSFNKANSDFGNSRTNLLNQYNKAVEDFFDRHIPKYR